MSQIEWCHRTWSPVLGCTKVSTGCRSCWAIRNVWRMAHNPNPKVRDAHEGLVRNHSLTMAEAMVTNSGDLRWTGEVRWLPERLTQPIAWRKPARIFVCPMSDWLHPSVPTVNVGAMLGLAIACTHHRFLFLTKRVDRLADVLREYPEASEADHLWFGVSVEDQANADARIPVLMAAPVKHRWVSAEPLLGPLDLGEWLYPGGIEWVVAGCESGKGARPDDLAWYWSLIEQCAGPYSNQMFRAKTPLFIKQARVLDNGTRLVKMPEFGFERFDYYPPELRTGGAE